MAVNTASPKPIYVLILAPAVVPLILTPGPSPFKERGGRQAGGEVVEEGYPKNGVRMKLQTIIASANIFFLLLSCLDTRK